MVMCVYNTDNTEHCCFHKGGSYLTATVNNFSDFVFDVIFWFIFRLRTTHDELLKWVAECVIVLRVKINEKCTLYYFVLQFHVLQI